MELNAIERYEVMAEAFRFMTGHMAPGKDVSPMASEAPYEERSAKWDAWLQLYGHAVHATIRALRVIDRPDGTEERT